MGGGWEDVLNVSEYLPFRRWLHVHPNPQGLSISVAVPMALSYLRHALLAIGFREFQIISRNVDKWTWRSWLAALAQYMFARHPFRQACLLVKSGTMLCRRQNR